VIQFAFITAQSPGGFGTRPYGREFKVPQIMKKKEIA
jgi:hypothetical protein